MTASSRGRQPQPIVGRLALLGIIVIALVVVVPSLSASVQRAPSASASASVSVSPAIVAAATAASSGPTTPGDSLGGGCCSVPSSASSPAQMGSAAPSNDPLGVGLDVGQRAPDFSIRLLDGSTVTLSSLRGRPVWLNFWASSCDACVTEMPFIERLYEERRGSGLAVVGISVESPAPDAVGLARALGVTYTLGFDRDGSITRLYRVALLPAQFWIDRAGVIRDWALGEVPPEVMAADVAKIVGR